MIAYEQELFLLITKKRSLSATLESDFHFLWKVKVCAKIHPEAIAKDK